MTLEGATPQSEEALTAGRGDGRSGTSRLMEEVVRRDNLKAALRRVRQNQGSPGTDGMTTEELLPYLRDHWERIREELLAGTYRPRPVKRQEIREKGGGVRQLEIPTVLDRFIQQAMLQVLQPRFDPSFSEHSYGFRPGRSAQQALAKAQRYVEEGRRYVVDVDLEKFFDRVNHEVLMGRLAKRIADKRMLRLIRRYLEAVARVITRQFLGMAFWRGPGGKLRRRVADRALGAMKERVREITGRSRGRSVVQVVEELRQYLAGWKAYFRMAETPMVFRRLDEWIRHRLRQIYLKQWRTAAAAYRELRARGAPEALAKRVGVRCQPWWYHSTHTVHVVLTNRHFDELGVPRLAS